MKFITSIAAAVCSALVVSASPVEKREAGGVLLCTGANATGSCIYKKWELEKCHQLEAPFHQNTATFAPDGEDFYCYPRLGDCDGICISPTGCTFGAVDFNYEHKYNLTAIQWNKLITSFDCHLGTATN